MTVRRRAVLSGLVAASLPLANLRAQVAPAARTLVAATGYAVDYDEYAAPGGLALIFMHGKNSAHRTPLMRGFAERVAAAGHPAILPSMPWSRAWNGTVADGHAALDALVATLAATGKRVVVGGLSLGAAFAMTWRPADPPAACVGKAFLNPGGLLDLFLPNALFWQRVRPEVEKARALVAVGKGREKAEFGGNNAAGAQFIEERYVTTPENFLAFHDTAHFPNIRDSLGKTKLPVFWSAGQQDPTVNAKRRTFEMLPRDRRNVYIEPPGDHTSAFHPAIEPLLAWLDANFKV
jgi:pimeloyl-ACP methyl ester carboxylesterase